MKRLWSAFTDDMDHCYFSGSNIVERHHIFCGDYKEASEKYGYIIPLTPDRHPNGASYNQKKYPDMDMYLKQLAQLHFEKNHGSREDFIEIFGKSRL